MISKSVIASVLEAAVSTGGDFAELFIEDSSVSSLNYLDGQLESSQTGRDFGVGIRIFSGLKCIYAYTNSFDIDSLVETALKAAQAVKGTAPGEVRVLNNVKTERIHVVNIMPDSVSKRDKLEIVRLAYDSALGYDSLIKQVSSRYSDTVQNVAIANTEGLYREDTRVYTRLMVNAVAEKDGQMQTGSMNPGTHGGYEFIQGLDIPDIAKRAAATAVVMAKAEYCKAGTMPVVIDNAFGGVIFHEACGHGLEATSVAKGTSV
ncbi:MAG TPA: TldD/PmbA family protein, partial [Clostridia bacterium]|nr:TldD/PmbA family protein [Clostridia bacterium]